MPELTPIQVRAAVAGEQEAAEAVVRAVGRIALPLALAILHDRDEAGEVAQNVAIDVLLGLGRVRDPARVDAWIRRIAVRHALRAARQRRSLWRLRFSLDELVGTSGEPGSAETDEDVALAAALADALAGLPDRQRLALVLRYVHGLSDREIAAALGCRPGTAASLLSRGRDALRRHPLYTEFASGGC